MSVLSGIFMRASVALPTCKATMLYLAQLPCETEVLRHQMMLEDAQYHMGAA